jgi:hypothetical protein
VHLEHARALTPASSSAGRRPLAAEAEARRAMADGARHLLRRILARSPGASRTRRDLLALLAPGQ